MWLYDHMIIWHMNESRTITLYSSPSYERRYSARETHIFLYFLYEKIAPMSLTDGPNLFCDYRIMRLCDNMAFSWVTNNGVLKSHEKSQRLDINKGWRRLIGCLKLQVILRKRATNHRALLQKMTYQDKESYGSSPLCSALAHRET